MSDRLTYICTKTIEWSLIFIIAVVPLIINPLAFDVWYRPKIASVQVLLLIAGIAWLAMALFRKKGLHWQWNALTSFNSCLRDCRRCINDIFHKHGIELLW